jgi:8-oxo-dGTP diphosphatase
MTTVRVGVALIIRRGPNILVQHRIGSHANGTWSVPGGHLEMWETFEQAALRELSEEAGPLLRVFAAKTVDSQ